MRGFDEDVFIFWTGLDVNSPFEQSAIDYVINNTGHSPVFWVNYPAASTQNPEFSWEAARIISEIISAGWQEQCQTRSFLQRR